MVLEKVCPGKWVADNEKIPLEMDAIVEFFCDLAHRKKYFGYQLYKTMKAKKSPCVLNCDK